MKQNASIHNHGHTMTQTLHKWSNSVMFDKKDEMNMKRSVLRMAPSGMLHRVALTRATWRNIPEDTILHSHCRENLKSYGSVLAHQMLGNGISHRRKLHRKKMTSLQTLITFLIEKAISIFLMFCGSIL
jgi:hypothetical protein